MKVRFERFLLATVIFLESTYAKASVETTLINFQNKILGTYLPLAAILGLLWAGFGFVTGRENAKHHLWYAIIGCGVGFGSQSIVAAVRALVN